MTRKGKTSITLQVDTEFRDAVAAAARAEQRTVASYVKRAIVLYMEDGAVTTVGPADNSWSLRTSIAGTEWTGSAGEGTS